MNAPMNPAEKQAVATPAPAPSVDESRALLPQPPTFATVAEERKHRKERLAGAFRIFSRFGLDEGAAGHITVRDPEFPDTFWLNPFGVHFSQVKVSNLIRVSHHGEILEGKHPLNRAAFAIHSRVHQARPDAVAAAHTHGVYGRAFSALGKPLAMINQDVCAFYNDHAVYDDFGGVVWDLDEGERIAKALGQNKAAILQNHGLITVGKTSVDEAAWFYISMERSCQVQMLAESALRPGESLKIVPEAAAAQSYAIVGAPFSGWFQFQLLYQRQLKENSDFLD